MNALWDAASAHAIGADWLAAELAPASALGRARAAREAPFLPGDEARAHAALAHVAALAAGSDAETVRAMRGALAGAIDPGVALARLRAGGVLGDLEFFRLAGFCAVLAAMQTLGRGSPLAAEVPGAVASVDAVLAPGCLTPGAFYLADAFDPALADAREAAELRAADFDFARSRLAERVAAYAGLERVPDGEFTLLRDALPGPVPPEVRVLREAPTYLSCELALDESALAALAARDAALARVGDEEERVRARLSARIASTLEEFEAAVEALAAFDLLLARVSFAQRHACVAPEIARDGEGIAFDDARYLPLAHVLERHGRAYAPISLELEGIGIVTGPNMGGKTTALRTLGFLAACVAFGVPVPAARARLPLFDTIAWLGIGAAEGEEGLLSAFGSEVIAVRAFLDAGARRPLALVDEFARTTSPREGRALLVALLETLRERGAIALAATHLSHVAPAGGAAHFTIGVLADLSPRDGAPLDLEAALARIARAMDYRLRRVSAEDEPVADAIVLADALGLEPALIARAKAQL